MFTSEPSLAQRIERMIGDTPIIDSFSQIRCDQPNAPDLAALMIDPGIKAGLIGSGMPLRDLNPKLPPDERVRRSLPYLKRIRNTASAWCLFRIFRDLYDFDDPQLTESNVRDLFDRVAKTGQNPDWSRAVLQDRSNIRAVVTSLKNQSTDASKNLDSFSYRLDVDRLFDPRVDDQSNPNGYFDYLVGILGEAPTTTDRLDRLIFDWLDRTVTGRVRFTQTVLPIDHRFQEPDEAHAQFVLTQAADDWEISETEVDWLSEFVAWSILKWHHDHKKAIQIRVDSGPDRVDRKNETRSAETWSSDMARVFGHFGNARFDLLTTSSVLSHDVAILAGRLPNVYSSGYETGPGALDCLPMTIERLVGLRVQAAPMTKIVGFLGNATYAEWSYGKLQIVRKAMSAALAHLVESRFFEEDEIPSLLRQILHDTPRALFELGEA